MHTSAIQELAARHGLHLTDPIQFNQMGIDFSVAFACDPQGTQWVLRIPRRPDLGTQIAEEQRILQLVRPHLSVQVPDWKIATDQLIAYPLLDGTPALTFDPESYAVQWYMPIASPYYNDSLAQVLVQLHGIPTAAVLAEGLKVVSPTDLRTEIADQLAEVKSALGIGAALEKRYRQWLDNDALWPGFTRFIHGDLYAGHVMTTAEGHVNGIIDWTTAKVSDIAIDFAGHMNVFGEAHLQDLIQCYERAGGAVWDQLFAQAVERAAAAPLAYGIFAIQTQDEKHIAAAKVQLGV